MRKEDGVSLSTRIAFVTDLHLDERQGVSDKALMALVEGVAIAKPHLILLGGDYCGHQVPHLSTPIERNWLCGLVCALADVAPVVAIRGNHDVRGDYDFLRSLRGRYAVQYEDAPRPVAVGDDAIVCLPWMDASAVSGDWHEGVRVAYRRALHQALDKGVRPIVLGHGALAGAEVRLGQPSVSTADPVLDPKEFCPERARVALWGHYHEGQRIEGAGCPAWYGGALFASQYGERLTRGWSLCDLGASPSLRLVQIPQRTRVMVVVSKGVVVEIEPDNFSGLVGGEVGPLREQLRRLPGALLKLRLVLEEGEDRGRAVTEARAALEGACEDVAVEVPVRLAVRSREGAQEVAAARTVREKVAAYFDRLEAPPEDDSREAALAVVGEIEREVLDAAQ